jgi:regulator of sigma E protease
VSDSLQNGLYIIPILAFLILMHELGHFVTARMCGVKVEEFGIGIPPRLWGFTRKGVLWSINAIPFGGFVRVKGEDGKNMDPDSMNAQPPHERAFFLAAGSAMNIFVASGWMILGSGG